MSTIVSMNYLLEAGVHFGHLKRKWNPAMAPYIFMERDDIYIIDLTKTVKKLEEAYEAMKKIAEEGGKVLFVGTKKQAQEAAEECAVRTNNYFVTERWLGGTLTNFRTIRSRVRRMDEIDKMEEDGTFNLLPKKEVIQIKKEYEKLNKNLHKPDLEEVLKRQFIKKLFYINIPVPKLHQTVIVLSNHQKE